MFSGFCVNGEIIGLTQESGVGIVLIIANKKTRQLATFGFIERSIVRIQQDGKLAPTGTFYSIFTIIEGKKPKEETDWVKAKRTNRLSQYRYFTPNWIFIW